MLQLLPTALKVTAPLPEPPVEVSVTGVPTVAESDVFEIASVLWVAAANENDFAAEVTAL